MKPLTNETKKIIIAVVLLLLWAFVYIGFPVVGSRKYDSYEEVYNHTECRVLEIADFNTPLPQHFGGGATPLFGGELFCYFK